MFVFRVFDSSVLIYKCYYFNFFTLFISFSRIYCSCNINVIIDYFY